MLRVKERLREVSVLTGHPDHAEVDIPELRHDRRV